MARGNVQTLAFNRGMVSKLGLARQDVKRLALAAETQTNWIPRVLGSMSLRSGLGYKGSVRNDARAYMLPFVFSTSDKALIELTDSAMRVWVNDAVIQRTSVATAVLNGTFPTNLANWTDNDEAAATSAWVAPNYMGLTGNGQNYAIRDQQVTVAAGDIGKEHGIHIVIARGPVVCKIGSSLGDDSYVTETSLDEGEHSLAVTPTGDIYIRLQSRLSRQTLVRSVAIEAAGDMVVATPWALANLPNVRYAPSGDILFCCDAAHVQYKIERRATRSWSCAKYIPENGPFRIPNASPTTMTSSVLTGNGTLTASKPFFKSTNVGGLMQLTSSGQLVGATLGALNAVSASVLVTGSGTGRYLIYSIASLTATGGIAQLQRSYDDATWADVAAVALVADATGATYLDGLDNQAVYYRWKATAWASAFDVGLSFAGGSIVGVARITGYTSSTQVSIEVMRPIGQLGETSNWAEGLWSDRRGWPSCVAFHEGRLWWGGKDKIVGSVSDDYPNFDPTTLGDSGPINRSFGTGPVDTINWLLPLQRLLVGAQSAEWTCRSTSLDEPLTPTNFNLKPPSTKGSAAVAAVKVDSQAVFVQRGGNRIYGLQFDVSTYDFANTHLSAVCPEIGKPYVIRMDVQMEPDVRVHCVRSDGKVAVLVLDKNEQVASWQIMETDGNIEDVVVLPADSGVDEDAVYYVVARTINGSTKRYLERWALESECQPDSNGDLPICKLGDSFVTYSGVPTTVITGLSHLEGEQVVVWADGFDVGYDTDDETLLYTVSGGQITLAEPVSNAMVGLPYSSSFKSGKLSQIPMQLGSAIGRQKLISQMAVILVNTHHRGLQFGPDFDHLDHMPSTEGGYAVTTGTIWDYYEEQTFAFPGTWKVDARLCLKAQAPRPCTVSALVVEATASE